jgi:hypothetical protein
VETTKFLPEAYSVHPWFRTGAISDLQTSTCVQVQSPIDWSVSWVQLYMGIFHSYDDCNAAFVCVCFNWAPRHEGVLGEWRYSSNHSLTSALDGGEWSASRPGCFTTKERAPGTHWIGGWVGSRAVLDAVVKRTIPSLRRESNRPTRSPALYRLSYHGSVLCVCACRSVKLSLSF